MLLRVFFFLLCCMVAGCAVKRPSSNWLLGQEATKRIVLQITEIDTTQYPMYYVLGFKAKGNILGKALWDKKKKPFLIVTSVPTKQIELLLGDVLQFKMEDITLRGHVIEGGIYVDGELYIDLSNEAEVPFYRVVEWAEE